MLQGQLCDRHSCLAGLLRQLPLELQRVVRAAPPPAVLNFTLGDWGYSVCRRCGLDAYLYREKPTSDLVGFFHLCFIFATRLGFGLGTGF